VGFVLFDLWVSVYCFVCSFGHCGVCLSSAYDYSFGIVKLFSLPMSQGDDMITHYSFGIVKLFSLSMSQGDDMITPLVSSNCSPYPCLREMIWLLLWYRQTVLLTHVSGRWYDYSFGNVKLFSLPMSQGDEP
jgi:hypothetical protein